jgi:hypothetical protein
MNKKKKKKNLLVTVKMAFLLFEVGKEPGRLKEEIFLHWSREKRETPPSEGTPIKLRTKNIFFFFVDHIKRGRF